MYNETPLSQKLGAPIDLWRAGREKWDKLIEHAQWQRRRANHWVKGRVKGKALELHQWVWVWDMQKEGNIGDKLAPLW